MPDNRFFALDTFTSGKRVQITDQEMHHMLHVMRIKEKESIELVNGKGDLAFATVEKIDKRSVTAFIDDVRKEPQAPCRLILAQGMPRLARLEYIVEKATELGVTDLWLFPAEKSEIKTLTDKQVERLTLILISAMKQCGRLYLPLITLMPPLAKWQKAPIKGFFGDVHDSAPPLLRSLSPQISQEDLMWIVGPEKGFSEEENSIMKDKLSFQGAGLCKNILRTDTAAIAGLSVLSACKMQ